MLCRGGEFLALVLDPLVFCRLPQHACFSFLQGLEEMSCRKSRFLWMEHTRMAEFERQLESAHHES